MVVAERLISRGLEQAFARVDAALLDVGLQRAVGGSDENVVYCRKCLFYQHRPSTMIVKAVISTPMGDEGKFDGESVPVGASVWITVTNPESPLHGRPILITKRPDNLFALTGGGGQSGDARRHMVLTGKPKKTRRDKELEQEIQEAEEYNEPLQARRRGLIAGGRRELRQAADAMMESLGLEKLNPQQLLQQKDDVQNYVADALGEEEGSGDEAKRITDTIMRQVVASERGVRERVQRDRQMKVLKSRMMQAREGERFGRRELTEELEEFQEGYKPMMMEMPQVAVLQGLSGPEQELAITQHFEGQVNDYFDEDRDAIEAVNIESIELESEDLDRIPKLMLGETVGELNLESSEKLQQAIDGVQSYWDKRKQVEEVATQLKKVPLAKVTPSVVQAIKARDIAPVSLAEIEERMDADITKAMQNNTATALYDALGEHWNDDTSLSDTLRTRGRRDTTMQFHINAGASSALAAMGKDVLGTRYDTSKLISDGNIELAAAGMALEVARRHDPSGAEYADIVAKVKEYNAVNQPSAEVRAMAQHDKLAQQYQVIQDQKKNAELLDLVQVSNLEADNLIAQRTNLGAALGSLQASATFYDRLDQLKGAKRAPVISVSVGDQADLAETIRDKLNLKQGYDIDLSDPSDVKLNVGLSSLGRYMKEAPDVTAQAELYRGLKTSMEGVSEDAGGNLVVDQYDVPGWRNEFQDAGGNTRQYKWRVEQRNDIEWLRAATTKSETNPTGVGGGLITRVTGAGKTNTALGFYGHKIAENPDYKAIVTVPKGRAAQWHEEATRFSDTPAVLIPDGTAKVQVDEILMSSEPGTIYVMGHREASRSHETLALLQADPDLADQKFQGITIDEPQELQARGQSGNIGALGKRLMKLKFDNRVGLTATPARRNPTEAYDLIKWTQGSSRNLGSKTSFVRTFSGFGAGTNAQDTAINKLFFDTISPYISGDRITDPNFKVTRGDIDVRRSEGQRGRQREIEAGAQEHITRRRQEIMQEARDNPKSLMRTGQNWESTLGRRAMEKARGEVKAQHQENIDGGDYTQNGKLMQFKSQLEEAPDQKHVVYIDSAVQRRALGQMFKDMGLNNNNVKNLASGTGSITGAEMASRVKMFRDDPRARVIMIDTTSSSGYNLQSGDQLHVLGTPEDAAGYLQAQGRVARMPRKGDVDIKTYRYEDDPTSMAKWLDLEAQLKVLGAAAPAMFV